MVAALRASAFAAAVERMTAPVYPLACLQPTSAAAVQSEPPYLDASTAAAQRMDHHAYSKCAYCESAVRAPVNLVIIP